MKVLAPAVTCLVTSHMKPYLRDLLDSLLAQTRRDFEAVVIDSGQWIGGDDPRCKEMAAIHDAYASHPLIDWVTTGEAPGLAERRCPSPWALNTAIRAGMVRGRYACAVSDDDLYRPRFMETMAGFLDGNPDAMAVCCSLEQTWLDPDGSRRDGGGIIVTGPRRPGQFDCRLDGMQVMYRREVLDQAGDPWFSEDPELAVCCHADGLWLERVAEAAGEVPAITDILCEHRFTPLSTYSHS